MNAKPDVLGLLSGISVYGATSTGSVATIAQNSLLRVMRGIESTTAPIAKNKKKI